MATSDSSIEVWWEPVPLRTRVIGYEIFYSMTDGEDLTKWQRRTVGLTTSAELVNLERDIPYAIRVAARTNDKIMDPLVTSWLKIAKMPRLRIKLISFR